MNRSRLALASIVSVVALACSAPPPAEVADATPTAAADDPGAVTPAPAPEANDAARKEAEVAAAQKVAAPAPEPVGQAAPGSLLDRMPKACPMGRVYVQVDKVLSGDAAASVAGLIDSGFKKNKDKTHADEVFAALKAGGVDPVKQIKELAVCQTGGPTGDMVAVTIDMSKVKDPAATLEKAIKAGDGEAPKRETAGDVTFLASAKSDDVLAIVGKNTLVFGKDRASIESATKGGTKGVGFADAASYVVWVDIPPAKGRGTVKESGDSFVLDAAFVDPSLVREKEDIMKKLSQIDQNVGKLPAGMQSLVKPLLPVIQNTKISSEADTLKLTTTFPKKTVPDVLAAAKKLGPDELAKAVRF